MGCNQSKADDIQKDNERSRNQPNNNQSSTVVQTPSKQIGVPKENDDQPQEVSYSQMREMDNDFFKDIIDRTAQKFIDVSAVGPDAKDNLFDREKDYSSQIKESNIGKSNILFGLPHLSQACNSSNLHNLLSQPVPYDTDLMNKFTANIVSSLNHITIKDCGELVVTFGASLKN